MGLFWDTTHTPDPHGAFVQGTTHKWRECKEEKEDTKTEKNKKNHNIKYTNKVNSSCYLSTGKYTSTSAIFYGISTSLLVHLFQLICTFPAVWSQCQSPPESRFWPESESLIWRRFRLRTLFVSSGFLCNFVAIYLTFVQFTLQLKLCLYTTVHLLLRKLKISLESSLYPQSLRHTIIPRVGVGVLNFLTQETESKSHKKNKDSVSLTSGTQTLRQVFPYSVSVVS